MIRIIILSFLLTGCATLTPAQKEMCSKKPSPTLCELYWKERNYDPFGDWFGYPE